MFQFLNRGKSKKGKDRQINEENSRHENSSSGTSAPQAESSAKGEEGRQIILPGVQQSGNVEDELPSPVLSDDDERFIHGFIERAVTPPVVAVDDHGEGSSATKKIGGATATLEKTNYTGTLTDTTRSDNENEYAKEKAAKEEAKALAYGKEFGEYIRNVFTKKDSKSKGEKKSKGKEREGNDEEKDGKQRAKEKGKGKSDEVILTSKEEEVDPNEFKQALEKLNLFAKDGKLLSMTPDFRKTIQRFTQILKDIQNGVPTAYNDLVELFDTSSSTFSNAFESLPKTLQRLITQTLPSKLTPEVLRTLAAASPAIAAEAESNAALGLRELVTKPGMLAGLLKGVINVLKTRFPLLMTGGVAAGAGVTIVMLILWYCYKRGRDVRLEQDAKSSAETDAAVETAGAEKAHVDESERENTAPRESANVIGDSPEALRTFTAGAKGELASKDRITQKDDIPGSSEK